jgi:hypothetical protein
MAPLPDSEPIEIGAPAASAPEAPGAPQSPGGDRELAALQIGFQGCRVLGQRLDPQLSGRAVLAARLAGTGEVVWAGAARVENLPRSVVMCLVERVNNTRFAPRGGYGTEIVIPVDYTRAGAPGNSAPTPASRQPPPPGTTQL